jgi:dihydroorotate dehydrogenase electron transfer subunit
VTTVTTADRAAAVTVTAQVLENVPASAYTRLVLAAPQLAARARPGQFVAVAVGDAPTAMLLRRAFSIHDADPATGTLQLVVAADGPGSTWVTRRRPGEALSLVGPLGRPFPDPQPAGPAGAPGRCVLVGGGYGAAPMTWWARELAAVGHEVHVVLGAATRDRLFGTELAVAAGATVHVTTDDGSAGTRGRVTDVLPDLLAGPAPVAGVYGCGPMAMLRAITQVAGATAEPPPVWVAVEESMACGIGVCMTCVLPVTGPDGVTRMTRSCTDGPTFAAGAIRWDAVDIDRHGARSRVPEDCLGAPRPGGH